MSIAQASLAVTTGTTYTQYVGSAQTVGAVVVLNESPYGLNVSNGSSSKWIAAQTGDLILTDSMGFNGALTITTDSYLDNSASAPSFLIYFTSFAPGEAIGGTYPFPLARLTSGGSVGIATQIINDNASTGTTVVEARPSGATSSNVLITNDGQATLTGSLIVGGTSSVGAAESGGGRAVLYYDTTYHIFDIQSPQSGANPTVTRFVTWDGSAQKIPFGIGGSTAFTPAYIDNNGNLTANAISQVAGQATAGSFGVPLIVAQATGVHITGTTLTTIVSFTPPATGLYRASFYAYLTGANPSTITAEAVWTEPSDSSTQFSYFTLQTSSAGHTNPATLATASIPTVNVAASYPMFIYAKSGGAINVRYQNSTATPNDFVSAMIERLS